MNLLEKALDGMKPMQLELEPLTAMVLFNVLQYFQASSQNDQSLQDELKPLMEKLETYLRKESNNNIMINVLIQSGKDRSIQN